MSRRKRARRRKKKKYESLTSGRINIHAPFDKQADQRRRHQAPSPKKWITHSFNAMNRSIDQFILQKKRRPATIFRYAQTLWSFSQIMSYRQRPISDLASPPRGRRLSKIKEGQWEVMIP